MAADEANRPKVKRTARKKKQQHQKKKDKGKETWKEERVQARDAAQRGR